MSGKKICLVAGLLVVLLLNACGAPKVDVAGDGVGQRGTEESGETPGGASLSDKLQSMDGAGRQEGTGGAAQDETGKQDGKEGSAQDGMDGSGREDAGTGTGSGSGADQESSGSDPAAGDGAEQEWTEEELLAYLAQFLPTASHKPDYIQPVIDALAGLPEEKPESMLKQKDVDCDTLQWFNGTYAMFLESVGMDYHFVGGNDDRRSSEVDYIQGQLESSWGITDRATSIDTLYWLAESGHASGYAEDIQAMALYGYLEMPEEELRKSLLEMADGESLTEEDAVAVADYFLKEKALYEACGENGLDAWDYCRFMQIAGSCYYAGYLTLEESLAVQLETAKAIQQQFSSWDEMNQSYLQGYIFWVGDSTAAYIRERAYERLQKAKDSPFNTLDFKMTLEKFW